MKKLLVIESSPNGSFSVSRQVTEKLVGHLKKKYQNVEVKSLDLNSNPVPHLTGTTVSAMFTPAENRTNEQKDAIVLSDKLTDDFLWADEIILSVPMWNFGVPSVVKAYIDHISRAGRTFKFGPNGLEGLAAGRKVYLVVASGSVFSEGPFAPFDQLAPYIKTFFGFIGITDVELIRAEGVNDPTKKEHALKNAEAIIANL